jgi:hypothetical protein
LAIPETLVHRFTGSGQERQDKWKKQVSDGQEDKKPDGTVKSADPNFGSARVKV